jgi:DNA-directed RNA polymerase alpha subunit
MAILKGTLCICGNGHGFYKSSSCPVCPTCEKEKAQVPQFGKLASPASRALENAGIKTLIDLSNYTELELLKLHGMGSVTIPKLKDALKRKGLSFRKQ